MNTSKATNTSPEATLELPMSTPRVPRSPKRRIALGIGCLLCASPDGVEAAVILGNAFSAPISGSGATSINLDGLTGPEFLVRGLPNMYGFPFISGAGGGFNTRDGIEFGPTAFRSANGAAVNSMFAGNRPYIAASAFGQMGNVAGSNNFVPFRMSLTSGGKAWGFVQYDYASGAGTVFYSTTASPGAGTITVSVPEPSSALLCMLALGAGGVISTRRRRKERSENPTNV